MNHQILFLGLVVLGQALGAPLGRQVKSDFYSIVFRNPVTCATARRVLWRTGFVVRCTSKETAAVYLAQHYGGDREQADSVRRARLKPGVQGIGRTVNHQLPMRFAKSGKQ